MHSDSQLPRGLYEQLLTAALESRCNALSDPRLCSLAEIDPDDAHSAVAQYLEHLIAGTLAGYRGRDSTDRRQRLIERMIGVLAEEIDGDATVRLQIANPLRRLLAVYDSTESKSPARPDTALSRSALLTGTRIDPSLGGQLAKEIATADRVDILCSFIRWSGLRIILDQLRELTERPLADGEGPRLRVITTSYMGATDPRAVDAIQALPNTEIRVSYDTERTRLHAKAYLIRRNTGFGSAYVGSANLSHAALSEGLEWTTKISQYELAYLWSKVNATFEAYWQDDEFEPFTTATRDKLVNAIKRERTSVESTGDVVAFDLHPWPFQEEILDVLTAERSIQGKNRHLVVAATGTGKTMIAAFDYLRWTRSVGERGSLLFVAHREEILRQALGTFRAVLRDQNFGDLLVGGIEPSQSTHLFCSIQSYNSKGLWRCEPNRYRYICVDEFHHAAAPSYRRLLDSVSPLVLLGLTATPERTDQLDVLQWFGGAASAEIRLPDAINRRLLCPFHYFGVSDSVDLDSLSWQRGGYRVDELDRLYTGNDARAALVLNKTADVVLDTKRARGLGFCVSVAHAEYMARFFTEHGVPSLAVSGETADDVRRAVQQKLRTREANFVFVVDLYNEGVDIPEVDTILFLRPTESLTVFLQQFGRGLRLHEEKECLTVIDFIGAQRREFRFAPRFRALSADPLLRIDDEVEAGFPHLPAGCVVQMERVAQTRVLANIRDSLRLNRPRIVMTLRELGAQLGKVPSLDEAVQYLDISIDDLLKRGLWSRLLVEAGLVDGFTENDEERLGKGIQRLSHIDDPLQIRFLLERLRGQTSARTASEIDSRRLSMLHVTLWGKDSVGWTLADADARLRSNLRAFADLLSVLEYRLAHTHTQPVANASNVAGPLAVHAEYTRDEILVGLGHWSLEMRPDVREGVLHLPTSKVDAFFVTLQKTENEYSPTTMYEDYAISPDLFHWQSQSTTSPESKTGQRYIGHRAAGYTPLLFVRERKQLASGLAAPYAFLGPCEYVKHEGSRPMSITWRLRHAMPARLLRSTARQRVG